MELLALSCAIFLGVITRWIVGFGFSMVFVPIAAWVVGPADAIGLTLVYELVAGLYMFIRLGAISVFAESLFSKVSSILGVALAFLLTSHLDKELLFTSTLLLAAIISFILARKTPILQPSKTRMMAFSVVSGIMGYITGMAGPPMIFYYYTCDISIQDVRQYLSGYFLLLYSTAFLVFSIANADFIFSRTLEVMAGACVVTIFLYGAQFLPIPRNKVKVAKLALYGMSVFLTISVITTQIMR